MIYVIFLILFTITGVISTYITSNKIVLQICVAVCSWTSFFVLMFMFKRLMPGIKKWEFIKGLLRKKYSIVKAGVITVMVWGLWHLPLWIISGYKGFDLLIYCVTFLIAIVSASVVMSVIYKKHTVRCSDSSNGEFNIGYFVYR